MYYRVPLSFAFAVIVTHTAVHATKLSPREYQLFTNDWSDETPQELHARRGGNPYINIVKGIFNSKGGNIIQDAANIPCSAIETLESDADQAEQFVSQIAAGQIPSLISDLPQEAVSEFGNIIGVATMVIDDIAGAAVTDIVNIFDDIEDGSITSLIEGIPTDIVNAITNGWDDFTDEIKHAWGDVTCFFEGGCPTSTAAGFCALPASASASATANGAAAAASASAAAGAAYTSAFYASESSALVASTSSANAASATEHVSTPLAPQNPATDHGQNTLRSTTSSAVQQSTPQSVPASSKGRLACAWAPSSGLVMVAAVVGLVFAGWM